MIYKKILLACLFVALLPSLGFCGPVKIAVLDWKVNSPEEMAFVRDAMRDMLTSRLGSNKAVEVARPDRVSDALAGRGGGGAGRPGWGGGLGRFHGGQALNRCVGPFRGGGAGGGTAACVC